jgi:hypothetical protein
MSVDGSSSPADLYDLDLPVTGWHKSPFSADNHCVEVVDIPGGVAVRDSKRRDLPALRFTAEEWEAFHKGVATGEM